MILQACSSRTRGASTGRVRHFPLLRSREAIMVKFADRLSNLSRMRDWPGDWQEDYLRESCFWVTEPNKKE